MAVELNEPRLQRKTQQGVELGAKPAKKGKPLDYSKPLQQHIVAMVLRMPGLMPQVRSALNPDHFDDVELSDILAWTIRQWDRYHEIPSEKALRDAFRERSQRQLLELLWDDDLDDPKTTVGRVREHARMRALRLAIMRSAYIINCQLRGEEPRDDKTGKIILDDPDEIVRKAALVGLDMSDPGEFLKRDVEAGIRDLLSPEQVTLFGTGYSHLDEAGCMLERGETGCVLGASKHGKSHLLAGIAINAARAGLNVAFYSLEMPKRRLRHRFYRRVTGNRGDIKEDPPQFADALREKVRGMPGEVMFKRYPAKGVTFDDIRAHLTCTIADGFKPDLLIVDYVGLVRVKTSAGELRHDLDQLWIDFRALVGEFDMYGWSAAQASDAALHAEKTTMSHFAEHKGIVRHIDVGIGISMTEDEKADQTGRFYVLASRNEFDGYIVNFEFDFSRSTFRTTSLQQPVAKKKRSDRLTTDDQREEEAYKAGKDREARKREDLRP